MFCGKNGADKLKKERTKTMKKTWQRAVSSLLAVCMMLAMVPASVFAEDAPENFPESGLDLSSVTETTVYKAGGGQ